MRNNRVIITLLFSGIFASCESDKKKSSESVYGDSASAPTSMPVTGDSLNTELNAVVNASDTSVVAPASTAGLNPEHGKPGHRCDIAVGAPLNSPPNNTIKQEVTTAPTAPTLSTPAPTITTSPIGSTPAPAIPGAAATPPGMNPPHGEPGHDCSIPVGSPLKK